MYIGKIINVWENNTISAIIKKIKRRYLGNILYHQVVIKTLREKYSYVYKDVNIEKGISSGEKKKTFYVWVMWWQGLDSMPDIIRVCYNSILENSAGCEVILITQENIEDYIKFPQYIISKFNAGIIPIAQYSDLVRFSLLSQYGGLWLDATTLVTNFRLKQLDAEFFTLRFKTKSQATPTTGRWAITVMSGRPNNILFVLTRNLLYEYWRKEDTLVKYFLTDYFILLLYTDVQSVKQLIDSVKWSPNNYLLKDFINDQYSTAKWENFISNNHFHTLSRKVLYNIYTKGEELTYYGYLHNLYLDINKDENE